MNQVERIIKKWNSIPEEKEWIAIDMKATEEDLMKLEAEYEYLSEIVEVIGHREVAI